MVDELAALRFSRANDIEKISPTDVLHAALSDPEVQAASHVVVIYGKLNDDGSASSGWLQGGNFSPYAQTGLLARVSQRLWEEA